MSVFRQTSGAAKTDENVEEQNRAKLFSMQKENDSRKRKMSFLNKQPLLKQQDFQKCEGQKEKGEGLHKIQR